MFERILNLRRLEMDAGSLGPELDDRRVYSTAQMFISYFDYNYNDALARPLVTLITE